MLVVFWLLLLCLREWSRHFAVDVIHRCSLLGLLSELEGFSKELEAKVALGHLKEPRTLSPLKMYRVEAVLFGCSPGSHYIVLDPWNWR